MISSSGHQGNIVLPGSKYSVRLITSHENGDKSEKLKASTLALIDCRETDEGRYTCSVVVAATNENLHCVTAYLHVLRMSIFLFWAKGRANLPRKYLIWANPGLFSFISYTSFFFNGRHRWIHRSLALSTFKIYVGR